MIFDRLKPGVFLPRLLFAVIISSLFEVDLSAQNVSADSAEPGGQFSFEQRSFKFVSDDGLEFRSKEFAGTITHLLVDFDADGSEELLVEESTVINRQRFFTAYIYHFMDSVYLIDSITSGITKPYHEFSEELNSLVLVTGDNYIDSILTSVPGDYTYSPKVFWLYDGKEFFSIEEEMYDEYLSENEELLLTFAEIKKDANNDCAFAKSKRPMIITIYMNYIFANEDVLAQKFINSYYSCPDMKPVIDNLKEIY